MRDASPYDSAHWRASSIECFYVNWYDNAVLFRPVGTRPRRDGRAPVPDHARPQPHRSAADDLPLIDDLSDIAGLRGRSAARARCSSMTRRSMPALPWQPAATVAMSRPEKASTGAAVCPGCRLRNKTPEQIDELVQKQVKTMRTTLISAAWRRRAAVASTVRLTRLLRRELPGKSPRRKR